MPSVGGAVACEVVAGEPLAGAAIGGHVLRERVGLHGEAIHGQRDVRAGSLHVGDAAFPLALTPVFDLDRGGHDRQGAAADREHAAHFHELIRGELPAALAGREGRAGVDRHRDTGNREHDRRARARHGADRGLAFDLELLEGAGQRGGAEHAVLEPECVRPSSQHQQRQ